MSKKLKKMLLLVIVLVMGSISSIPVSAKTTVSKAYYTSPTKTTEQVRYITVTKKAKWTKLTTVAGQPSNGTYVKKGDALYYGSSGGNQAAITFSVGVGAAYGAATANIALSIPVGSATSSYYGKILTASKSGYYLIKAKKKVKPSVVFVQYRHKVNVGGYPFSSTTTKWSSWSKAKYSKTSYKIKKTYSKLVKQ